MTTSTVFVISIIIALIAFTNVRQRALVSVQGNPSHLHSLPRHYGYYAATCVFLPAFLVFIAWLVFGKNVVEGLIISGLPEEFFAQHQEQTQLLMNSIRLVVENGVATETSSEIIEAANRFHSLYNKGIWATFALAVGVGLAGWYYARSKTKPTFRARNVFERYLSLILIISSIIAIMATLGIVLSLLFESIRFFQEVPITDFLFGTKWSPQTAIRADQVASSGAFGALPLFAGTIMITVLAMLVAGPIGLFSAIYLTQYASSRTRKIAKPTLEILAGIPTVVYGFFAALTISPLFRGIGSFFGLDIASESALVAGFVMGIMIIPFVSSLSDDAITAVPNNLKEGSMALGATPSETITKVILPAALPGIAGAFLLAVSRAIGETMIVVMAAGMQPNLTANPFEAVTTVTVQIVATLTGDQEFDSTKTLSAFALGLTLFVMTMILNVFALRIVRKYREVYE